MEPRTNPDITDALRAWEGGDPAAIERLMPLVYDQLRRVAHRQLLGEAAGHTLETTALVHEAFLRLAGHDRSRWQGRSHFFAIAAQAMRRVLIDHARRHGAARRGGRRPPPVPLDRVDLPVAERAAALLALDEALDRMADLDPQMARVVECRFFGGLTEAETAEALGVSRRTVTREWTAARAWLWKELHDDVG